MLEFVEFLSSGSLVTNHNNNDDDIVAYYDANDNNLENKDASFHMNEMNHT